MKQSEELSLLPILLVIVGWIVSYFVAIRVYKVQKRKEVRISYLINAWRDLESASNRESKEYKKRLEQAIADIQLFGNEKQIKMAISVAEQLSGEGTVSVLDLLNELRNNLRDELGTGKASKGFKFLRFTE